MAYFAHGYKKVFVGSQLRTTGKTTDLTFNQFGFFNPMTWSAIPVASAHVATYPNVVLAAASYHDDDHNGVYGGYKESLKSQPINPHFIHRFLKVPGNSGQSQIVQLGWNGTDAGTTPSFVCGANYSLRIDLKGSAALRFFGPGFHRTFDYFTGCCTTNAPVAVDPISVLLGFADMINKDPVFSDFVYAEVIDGTENTVDPATYEPVTDPEDAAAVLGALVLTTTYYDTFFSNCSFDPLDHFGLEPIAISSVQLLDDSGNACPDFEQLVFTVKQAGAYRTGSGEQIMRDLVLSNEYRQERFPRDARMRQAEGLEKIYDQVDRIGLYTSYYIMHSVPHKSNPTGVYDRDRYVVQLSVLSGVNMSSFESWMLNYLTSAGTGVKLETI